MYVRVWPIFDVVVWLMGLGMGSGMGSGTGGGTGHLCMKAFVLALAGFVTGGNGMGMGYVMGLGACSVERYLCVELIWA